MMKICPERFSRDPHSIDHTLRELLPQEFHVYLYAMLWTLNRLLTRSGDSLVSPAHLRAQPKCRRHENGICENSIRSTITSKLILKTLYL